MEEIDRNFKHVKNIVNENNLKQRIRYRFPKHGIIDQLEIVFVFDLETHNDQDFAETYAAGLYDVNRLRDKWDRDSTSDELAIEREEVTVFDVSNGSTVMSMLKYISDNYEGDERTFIDKDGDETVSSYRLLFVAHNSSGFDSCVVLNSLVKEIREKKLIKTARGFISLSFRCGVKIVNRCEVPQYIKSTCSKSHVKGSLEKSVKNIVFNLNFSKEELNTLLLIKVVLLN